MTILLDAEGATATLYRDAPEWDGLACCALGNLNIPHAAAGHALVRQALTVAAKEGFQAILGPMDGDTWHPYRAVTQSDGRPPFLMEPVSGPHDVTYLETAGLNRFRAMSPPSPTCPIRSVTRPLRSRASRLSRGTVPTLSN